MSVVVTPEFAVIGRELDINDAEALKSAGQELITNGQAPLRVDLGGLETANSVSVAVLVAWYRAAAREEKRIDFVNLSPELQEIIEFSGLSRLLLQAAPGL